MKKQQIKALIATVEEIQDSIVNLHYLPKIIRTLFTVESRLLSIEAQLKRVAPAEDARAICDNCKISVILPYTDTDKARDYVQNIGWVVKHDEDMTLCPGCAKIRADKEAQ